MKMTPTHLLPFLLLLLLLLLSSFIFPGLSVNPGTQQMIQDICSREDDFQFCKTTFDANLRSDCVDARELTDVAISTAALNSNEIRMYAEKLGLEATEEVMKRHLTECADAYGKVSDSFTFAGRHYSAGASCAANQSVSQAMGSVNSPLLPYAPTPCWRGTSR